MEHWPSTGNIYFTRLHLMFPLQPQFESGTDRGILQRFASGLFSILCRPLVTLLLLTRSWTLTGPRSPHFKRPPPPRSNGRSEVTIRSRQMFSNCVRLLWIWKPPFLWCIEKQIFWICNTSAGENITLLVLAFPSSAFDRFSLRAKTLWFETAVVFNHLATQV